MGARLTGASNAAGMKQETMCVLFYFYEQINDDEVAQLSQRDRAALRVIDYFVKSLKVIRNGTDEGHV